ncbi:hypothetical protein C1H46_031619 [Malus baccata]|uniref:Uncharacterized protein n=1 Tax=Malus baccata TaxID=106549 RepID=A0A540L8M2_MALBA|nr:hypothetical protein C1H46_031619 [Malus baccata]
MAASVAAMATTATEKSNSKGQAWMSMSPKWQPCVLVTKKRQKRNSGTVDGYNFGYISGYAWQKISHLEAEQKEESSSNGDPPTGTPAAPSSSAKGKAIAKE